MGSNAAPYIVIARILRTQGLKGEVRIEIVLEDDRNFQPDRPVILAGSSIEVETSIEYFRRQHGRCIVKLRGIDSIADAERLIGGEIRIRKEKLLPLGQGWFYTFQLKGCRVFEKGRLIGAVTDVLDFGGSEVLKVERDGEETLIPFAGSYLTNVDVAAQRIDVDLPEGLLDLNS